MAAVPAGTGLDQIPPENFPLPESDFLDLDFDFDSTNFLDEALGLQDTPMDSMLDQQYGAVAALATQAGSNLKQLVLKCVRNKQSNNRQIL